MEEITLIPATVLGLTQVVKSMEIIPKRFTPLVSIVLGVTLSALYMGTDTHNILMGVVYGLMASGFWDLASDTFDTKKK
jgi:hypothetical protein